MKHCYKLKSDYGLKLLCCSISLNNELASKNDPRWPSRTFADRNSQLQLKNAELGVKVILDALADILFSGGQAGIQGFGRFH
jgi:hypothetical protein